MESICFNCESREFARRIEGCARNREDVTLFGVDYTALPVDADGEVIHIGELVDEKLPFGGYAPPAPIDTMELSRGASGYRWMVKLDAENRALVSPKLLRHHHAPTVEDLLREFADIVRKERIELATIGEDTIADLERENAKLRELVRVFYHCTTSGVCDECPVNGGGAVHLAPDTICDTMHDRMRELGVEVDA